MYIMKVVCTSDTHGLHRDLNVPDGDVLVIAGDISMFGELKVLQDVNDWAKSLPHKYKILTAGNHDITFETKPETAKKLMSEFIYLENSGIEIDGKTFWGSPITSTIQSWAFVYIKESERYPIWNKMPSDLDMLITHTPPSGILDKTISDENAGDRLLNSYIVKNKPKHHIFGHIHESYGFKRGKFTNFYNVSAVNEVYLLQNPPVIINI